MATQRRSEPRSTSTPVAPGGGQISAGTDDAQAKASGRRRASQPPQDRAASEQAIQSSELKSTDISHEARYLMIQQAAYLRAERRGFEPGFELEDWLAAENEVDTLLGAGRDESSAQ